MKRHLPIRALCAVLCAALFLGTFSILFSAINAEEPTDEEVILTENAAPALAEAALASDETAAPLTQAIANPLQGMADWFFRNFGFIGFILDPYQFTIINQKPVFQFLLGFNDFYDIFPFVMNVYADTIKCEFPYNGKDWRIQLWKGGYGVFLATGGEIGVYQKEENSLVNHYICPPSQDDWLFMEYTIYNRGKKLFTRPSPYLTGDEGPYWWAPGYKVLSICTDFLSSPRKNVIMDTTLELKSAEMRQLFVDKLREKGFSELGQGSLGLNTPEKYRLVGEKSVRLIWQHVNESWY